MELDVRLAAIPRQHLEGVHAKAGHGAVALGDARIVQQEGQLQTREREREKERESRGGRQGRVEHAHAATFTQAMCTCKS